MTIEKIFFSLHFNVRRTILIFIEKKKLFITYLYRSFTVIGKNKNMNQFWIIVLYFLVYQSDVYLGSPYFGYQVSLRDLSNKHFCSGAFINDRFILTTACCAHARSPNFIKAIKKADMEDNTYEILIEKIISHEHFNLITKHGNIALLKTKQKVFFPFYDEPMFIEKSFESNYNLGFYLYGTESSKVSFWVIKIKNVFVDTKLYKHIFLRNLNMIFIPYLSCLRNTKQLTSKNAHLMLL